MRRGVLHVVGDRIGSADLELDPEPPRAVRPLEDDVGARVIAEQRAVSDVEQRAFSRAAPASRTVCPELLLEMAGKSAVLGWSGSRARQQEAAARASKELLDRAGKLGRPILTEITPASTFYRAGEYHQRYVDRPGVARGMTA